MGHPSAWYFLIGSMFRVTDLSSRVERSEEGTDGGT